VRDELAKLDVVTFFGPVKFGANGQINSLDPPVFQIQAPSGRAVPAGDQAGRFEDWRGLNGVQFRRIVIASAAKQSWVPATVSDNLDCFVASLLAMTEKYSIHRL